MCGIAGYINTNLKPIKDSSCIWSMLKVQKHRGPDDSGVRFFNLMTGQSHEIDHEVPCATDGNFEGVLGFNRLSILDLSKNGHQPMATNDGKVLLALNGEIYNAFDYKGELERWGYSFKSTTDTEVVLALYLRYGFEEMLKRLNGMFAIVIVDLWKNELLVTRDRFGIKPMYYLSFGETFAFSSELKSFRYIGNFAFSLFEEQIDEYLLFRNNLHGTLFKNIVSLTPGHYISFTHNGGLVIKRYHDLNKYIRLNENKYNTSYYGEKLEGWLNKSVQRQLLSDVKLGCQLSGGIDSSLVTWLANRNSTRGSFESVSIVFRDPRLSEERYIDRVTEKLEIRSHKFLLESDYFFDNFEKATWHLEEPINHPNTVAIYKLSQRAKEFVTVLLSGEGADEVFGGYSRFHDLAYPYQTRRLLHEIKENYRYPLKLIDYFDPEYRAVMATAFMTPSIAKKLRASFSNARAISERKMLFHSLSGSYFDRQVKYEMYTYLPDLLLRQDKMSMAHSIENRVPFLDNELVDNSFTIPKGFLLLRKSPDGYNNEKYLLKKMTANTFGNDFAFRDKMGFGIPMREFFLNNKFIEYLNDKILPGIRGRGLFDYKLISDWLSNLRNLKYNEMEALWVVVSFEIWASIYLDSNYEIRNTQF